MSEKPESADQASDSLDPVEFTPAAASPGTAAPTGSDTFAQVLKISNQYWLRLQPVLQEQGSRLLRITSQSLSSFADRLDQGRVVSERPAAPLPEPLPFEETLTKLWKTMEANLPTVQARLQDVWVRLQPLLLRLEEFWLPYLAKLKTRLPASLQNQVSDRTLTGILAGVLIFLLWTINGFFSGHAPTAMAESPTVISQRPIASQPVASQPVAFGNSEVNGLRSQVPADVPIDPQTPVARSVRRKLPTPGLANPPRSGETAPVQNALIEVATPYVEDLILSITPDLASHRLTLKVSSAWYDLASQQQDDLAKDLLDSSQRFDFHKLEIKDSQNDLLARTPVVGDEIVIFRRHKITLS